MRNADSVPELVAENRRLEAELTEARELLHALRKGQVDALVSSEGDAIYGVQLMALAVEEAQNYTDALAIVVRRLCEATGYVYGEAWTVTSNGRALERTGAWHGTCSQAVLLHESVAGLAFDPPHAKLVDALSSGEPRWIGTEDVPASARATALKDAGMQVGIVLPLASEGEVLAVLVLWSLQGRRNDATLADAARILQQSAASVRRKREQDALEHTLVALERTVRDRSREMADLSSRLAEQSERRERAEKLSSERERAATLSEQTLERQTDLLQAILDSMVDGVLVTDRSGRVLHCNPAARALLGEIPAHIPMQAVPDLFGLCRADGITPFPWEEVPLARALRGAVSERVEIFLRDGSARGQRAITMTARPLRDGAGAVYGAAAVFHDVTERRREEAQRIQHVEERRDMIVREVHHRIKNHLAAMIELLHRHAHGQPEVEIFLKQIEKQLYAIAAMYGLEMGAGTGTALGHIVRSVSQNAQSLFGLRVKTAFDEPRLQELRLSEEGWVAVALALNELLVNACKYGTGNPVEIRVGAGHPDVVLEVMNGVDTDIRLPPAGSKGRMSGLALAQALLPRDKASLEFRCSERAVTARVRLAPDLFTGGE